MNESLKAYKNASSLEEQEQPLKLTAEEMENPETVIADFFEHFTLWDARYQLKDWLDLVLTDPDINERDAVDVYDHLEKLVEAAWVFNKDKNLSGVDKRSDK